jgi:hypothetical protein
VYVVGHKDVAKELELLVVPVEVEAVIERDDKARTGKDWESVVDDGGDVIDVTLETGCWLGFSYTVGA